MMSSVKRAISASGSAEAPPGCGADAASAFPAVAAAVAIGLGVVHGKGCAAGRRYAEARQQRHDAMGAGTHRHAGTIDDGCHIVRMRAPHLEGDDGALLPCAAEDAQ